MLVLLLLVPMLSLLLQRRLSSHTLRQGPSLPFSSVAVELLSRERQLGSVRGGARGTESMERQLLLPLLSLPLELIP